MDLEYYVGKLWYKIVYLILVIVYLVNLHKLNQELLTQNFDSAFALLAYKDYVALKFFGMALGLFAVGCYLIYREVRELKSGLEDFREIIIAFCTIIVVIVLLILIIVFIDNPILQAVLTAVLAVVGVAAVATS